MRNPGGRGRPKNHPVTTKTLSDNDKRVIRIHCDWARRTGVTRATLHHRHGNLRRLAQCLPVDLLDATAEHLDAWQASLTVGLSSVRTYTAHVKSFYRWAVEAGHLDGDPSARLPSPKIPPRTARPVSESDLELLLKAASEPLRTWLLLAGYMGLRSAEIAQIRREDITEHGGRMMLSGVGKGQKPFTMAVPAQVVPYLAAYLGTARGQLWRAPMGGPLAARHCTKEAGDLMRDLGMSYTLHCLRHRFGTAMYAQTRDLLITQEAMRHASPANTRLYVLTSRPETTAAIDQLAKSLRGPSPSRRRKPPETGTDAA